jgi:hypothetical protein
MSNLIKIKGYHYSELTSKYQVTYSNGYYSVPQEQVAVFREELKKFDFLSQ